jgi:glutamate transport system permease protein
VPVGQAEAARAIGLTFNQSLSQVILPQAFRGAIAPLGSVLIASSRTRPSPRSSAVPEAAALMRTIIENETGSLIVFFIFALGFVILTLPVGIGFTSLSRRLAVKR